jgi:hypothetical protein
MKKIFDIQLDLSEYSAVLIKESKALQRKSRSDKDVIKALDGLAIDLSSLALLSPTKESNYLTQIEAIEKNKKIILKNTDQHLASDPRQTYGNISQSIDLLMAAYRQNVSDEHIKNQQQQSKECLRDFQKQAVMLKKTENKTSTAAPSTSPKRKL